MSEYVFDTSALLAYIEDEEGAADISRCTRFSIACAPQENLLDFCSRSTILAGGRGISGAN